MSTPVYRRILLKLSGEALAGKDRQGINPEVVQRMASEIVDATRLGVEVGLVIGGGNIFRGLSASQLGMDRVTADYMGMMATLINALALQDAIEKLDVPVRLMTALEIKEVGENFIARRALRHLEKGRVVIFGAGTGNPYFSTDTAAVLRAIEIQADVVLKGTKVDGVYSDDPVQNSAAHFFEKLTFNDVITGKLHVMDFTSVTLCMENNLPLRVFNMNVPGNLIRLLKGEMLGTTITGDDHGTTAAG